MAPEEICQLLKNRFSEAVEDTVLEGGHPYARVAAGRWSEVAKFLRDYPRLALNLLRSISVDARSLPLALAGTVVLAAGVSVLETPCTAGYPLLWANILAEQQVGMAEAVPLFLLYMAIFLLDELVVFGAAVVAMRATKLEERAGRVLRLVGGSVMIVLAATLILAPEALSSLAGSIAVFGVAGAIVLVVLAVEWIMRRTRRDSILRSG